MNTKYTYWNTVWQIVSHSILFRKCHLDCASQFHTCSSSVRCFLLFDVLAFEICVGTNSTIRIVGCGYAFGESRDRLRQPCRLQRWRGVCRRLAASRHGCRHPFCSSEVCVCTSQSILATIIFAATVADISVCSRCAFLHAFLVCILTVLLHALYLGNGLRQPCRLAVLLRFSTSTS